MKKRLLLCIVGVLLCFLITSPQMLAATSVKIISSEVIGIETSSSATTVKAFNMTFPAHEYVTVKTFGNGTRKATISVNVTLSQHLGVSVTMETMIPPSGLETAATPSFTPKNPINGTLPHRKDSTTDNLWFLYGGDYNDTMWVSYSHDDNYNVYYPGAWARNYSLPDAAYPEPLAQQTHAHLPVWMMDNWANGVADTAMVEEYALGLGCGAVGTGGSVLSLLAGFGVLSLSGVGALAVLVIAVIGGIASIFGTLLSLSGQTQAQYIRDVVRESDVGDGWMWTWGAMLAGAFAWIFHPPIWNLVDSTVNPSLYEEQIARLNQFHRVGIGFDDTVQFQQSWGAGRSSPQLYSIDVWGEEWVNSGFFGLSTMSR